MTTVLITGASGFFGESLIDALKKSHHSYRFICLYHSKKIEVNDARFSWVQADLLDHGVHKKLMQAFKPTALVHLAWDVPGGNFWHSFINVDWLYASVNLFKEFCEAGGVKFIGAGSGTEYEWGNEVLDEATSPLSPTSLYGECKRSVYAIIKKIQQREYKNTALTWARIGYFFGQGEPEGKLISRLIQHLRSQSPLNLVEKETSRPYAHVKYAGEALAHVLFNYNDSIEFNLSGTVQYSLKEIVDFIGKRLGKSTACISYGAYKSPIIEPICLNFDTVRLEKIIGYKILDTFYDDLKKVIENVIG